MIAAALVVLAAIVPARPVTLAPAAADSVTQAIQKDRHDTEEWLRTSPTSYLAAIQRVDFGNKSLLTVGGSSDNDVRLRGEGITDHHLQVSVTERQFEIEALDGPARFTVEGRQQREATVGPSSIGVGRYQIRLSHQGFPALIVFDPRSPDFQSYKGLTYFPVDLSYRYLAKLARRARPDTVIILSTRGNKRRAQRVGWFDFSVAKTACRLEVTRLLEPGVGENDYSVFFRDATTGHETYAVGRYVDPKLQPDGRYLLDFNLAYNPACAFSDHYNCPIPTKANALKVPIRAGEMDAHYH
jgi:hypothetical protein